MAKAPKPQKEPRKKSKGMASLFFSVVIVSMFLLKTTTIFVIMGMLPAIVAYYADVSKNMLYFRSLAACNLAGIMPFAADMIARGNTSSGFISIATDPITWLTIFGSAGVGALLVSACPMIARIFLDITQQGRIAGIEMKQRRIVEEWGIEVQRTEKQL